MRFKGLGEMNPNKLEVSLRSNIEHVVNFPDNSKKLEALISIVTNTDIKRIIMNDPRCTFNHVLQEVLSVK